MTSVVLSNAEDAQFLRQLVPRDRSCPENPDPAGLCFDAVNYKIRTFSDTGECPQRTDCYFGLDTGVRGPRGFATIYKKFGSTVDLPGYSSGVGVATADVSCEPDEAATGGGWKWVGNFKEGTDLRDVVVRTNDSVSGTPPWATAVPYGWTVTLWNYGTASNNKFRAFVHCAVPET